MTVSCSIKRKMTLTDKASNMLRLSQLNKTHDAFLVNQADHAVCLGLNFLFDRNDVTPVYSLRQHY